MSGAMIGIPRIITARAHTTIPPGLPGRRVDGVASFVEAHAELHLPECSAPFEGQIILNGDSGTTDSDWLGIDRNGGRPQ